MHRFVCSATIALLTVTVALSDEFVGRVTKLEDGKITFTKGGFGGKKKNKDAPKAEPITMTLDDNCKFVKAKRNKKMIETDGDLEGGRDAFTKRVQTAAAKKGGGKKGRAVLAQIVTTGEGDNAKVTEIRVFQGGGKKKKAKDAAKTEPAKTEPAKTEPAKTDPAKTDSAKKDADKKKD